MISGQTHKRKAASFLVTAFGLAVLLISSSTSFGFFYTYFDSLIPAAVLDTSIGALISGVVGVLLFDVACAIWLFTFLHHSETPEQRAIALIMTIATFIGAAAASVAYLGLTADGDLALDAATSATISTFSLVVVIIGVIANFGAMQAYQRFSHENKLEVREADRRDKIQIAEDEQAAYLDGLIAQQVKQILTDEAATLAQLQARRIAARFQRSEAAKYAESNAPSLLASVPIRPVGSPQRDLEYANGNGAQPHSFRNGHYAHATNGRNGSRGGGRSIDGTTGGGG